MRHPPRVNPPSSTPSPAPHWPSLVDTRALAAMRLQAHHAAQLLTAYAAWALEPRDDDAHRSFCWLEGPGLLATGSDARVDSRRVTLALGPLEVGVTDTAGGAQVLALHGRTMAEARGWLTDRVVTGARIALPHPDFDLPAHPVTGGGPFRLDPQAAVELERWFGSAAWALTAVSGRSDAGPIRCWPHHFDIAFLITLPSVDDKGRRRTVGVGMTPGDRMYPEPYGYVSPWPAPPRQPLPALPGGHWHTEGWFGAVLPAQVWASGGPEGVTSFFEAAIERSIALHR